MKLICSNALKKTDTAVWGSSSNYDGLSLDPLGSWLTSENASIIDARMDANPTLGVKRCKSPEHCKGLPKKQYGTYMPLEHQLLDRALSAAK